jgi:hypothetical protein
MTIGGRVVTWDGTHILFTSGMTIDADGAPKAYAPRGSGLQALDNIGNAGHPGNWWALVTDRFGQPLIQGEDDPAPGFYISTTAYQRKGFGIDDPHRYLDSTQVPFIVVPGPLRHMVAPVVLGCRAIVTNLETGRVIEAVVGDIGPDTHLGEGSIRLAQLLGIPADIHGGRDFGIQYTLFPGQRGLDFELMPA